MELDDSKFEIVYRPTVSRARIAPEAQPEPEPPLVRVETEMVTMPKSVLLEMLMEADGGTKSDWCDTIWPPEQEDAEGLVKEYRDQLADSIRVTEEWV